MQKQILTFVRLSELLANTPEKDMWLAATAGFWNNYKWIRRRLISPSWRTAGNLQWRLSLTVIELFIPWPCLGFKSACGAQFVNSMLCDLWPALLKHSDQPTWDCEDSLHLNDQSAECKSHLTKDWKAEAQFMNCQIFWSFFCYIMKRARGNQGIIKTVNIIFVQRSKWWYWTAVFSFFLFFF